MSLLRAIALEHPGWGVVASFERHTEGGVVARGMCPSTSSQGGLDARLWLRVQPLGVAA